MPEFGGMTLARVKRFLDLSGADREAGDIINADGIYEVEDNPQGSQGHSSADVDKLREELLLKLERERSDEVLSIRAKQKQILSDRKGRESELKQLQQAEESHREMLLKDKQERAKLGMDLHVLRSQHLKDMEDETTRELAALQRERELLLAREKENTDALDEARREIMKQDEVYHRALDEARSHLQDAENGRNNAHTANRQRQQIVKEQVELAERHGTRAGTLREEQTRLRKELREVQERIQRTRNNGGVQAPKETGDDALATLMSEAGIEEQAVRLRKLKRDFEQENAEAILEGFLKEYDEQEEDTRKQLKRGGRALSGLTGEYAEATANEFLDDWLKTDAQRAREAAAAAAAASTISHKNSAPAKSFRVAVSPTSPATAHNDGRDRDDASTLLPKEQTGNGGRNHRLEQRDESQHLEGKEAVRRSSIGSPETVGPDDRGAQRARDVHDLSGSDEDDRSREDPRQKGHRSGHANELFPANEGNGGKFEGELGRRSPGGHGGHKHDDDRDYYEQNGKRVAHGVRQRHQHHSRHHQHHHHAHHGKHHARSKHHHHHRTHGDKRPRSPQRRRDEEKRHKHEGETIREQSREKHEELNRNQDDIVKQLTDTVRRLEGELSAARMGVVHGGAWGAGSDSNTRRTGNGGLVRGAPWTQASALQHYIASVDAENARMMAEIQGIAGTAQGQGALGFPGMQGLNFPAVPPPGGNAPAKPPGFQASGSAVSDVNEDTVNGESPEQPETRPEAEDLTASRIRAGKSGRSGNFEGLVSPRTKQFRSKMMELEAEHQEAVKTLQFKMERLKLNQQLEDMCEMMAMEKKQRQDSVAHEEWVTEQKRSLQVIKIEKMVAKERQLVDILAVTGRTGPQGAPVGGLMGSYGSSKVLQAAMGYRPELCGIVQRSYNQDAGFCVFWDYVMGLPKRAGGRGIGSVRLAFGLYVGKRLEGKMISTRWITPTAGLVKNENTDRQEMVALLETRNAFAGIPRNAQARLVVELQFKDQNGVHSKTKDTLGWGSMHVFKPEKGDAQRLTVRAGMTRLTLFPGRVDLRVMNINDGMSAVSKSYPIGAFLRLVHGEDINAAAAFVVNPDTHHLYVDYGRGHLLRADRRKFMAGTFLRSMFFIGKLKRAVAVHKRDKTRLKKAAAGVVPTSSTISIDAKDNARVPGANSSQADALNKQDTKHVIKQDTKHGILKNLSGNPSKGQQGTKADIDGNSEQSSVVEVGRRTSQSDKTSSTEEQGSGDDVQTAENDSVTSRAPSDTASKATDDVSGKRASMSNVSQERRVSSLSTLLVAKQTIGRRASLAKRRASMTSRLPFLKGDGFDLYVDVGVGMPHCCTITKVVVRPIGLGAGPGTRECSAIAEVDSLCFTPVFGLREEFRTEPDDRMDMTTTIMIRIDTMDRASKQHRAVGYALLAIFMDPSGKQPTKPGADGAFLREGAYQIPLYQRPPPDMKKVNAKSLASFPRVPLASVLVRVKPAAKTPDGKTVGCDDVPPEDWKKYALVQPMPEFAPGVYDNSELVLTEVEKEVLEMRAKDEDEETVGDTADIIQTPTEPAPDPSSANYKKEFAEWAATLMEKKPKKLIEYWRAEKYRPGRGFTVHISALNNMKLPGAFKPPRLYKVIYSLLRPGLFYKDPPEIDQAVKFTQSYDGRSPQTAPRFQDPPHVFAEQKIDQRQCIVVDVRFLKVDPKESTNPEEPSTATASGAWGLLPTFHESDVATGSFVVPLLSGPVPTEIVSADDPMEYMLNKAKARHPNYRVLEGSSAIVQICNALLKDVLPPAVQDPELNYVRVKQLMNAVVGNQEKYVYVHVADAGPKSVDHAVPKAFKGRRQEFFSQTNKRFATATGLVHVVEAAGRQNSVTS